MKTILHILALFLLPALVNGQEILVFRGQVTDAATNEPLSDCHIYISCQKIVTISDENGYFELEVPKCYMTQCLIVSHMGYARYLDPVHNIYADRLSIELDEGVIELAELVITPDHYRIIHRPEFEPFRADYQETFSVDGETLEAFQIDQLDRLITMY